MPRRLPASFRSLLSRDDAAGLMAALSSFSEPLSDLLLDRHPILFQAAQAQAPSCVAALLAADSDPAGSLLWRDTLGENALFPLVRWADPSLMASALSIAGSEALSQPDENGWTPFHLALERARWEIAELMLRMDPALAKTANPFGRKALRSIDEPSYLFRNGALQGEPWTAPPPSLVEALLDAGADPWAGDERGMQPLHIALLSSNPAVYLPLLDRLEAGLSSDDPETRAKAESVLASRCGRSDLVVCAVSSGDLPALRRVLDLGVPAEPDRLRFYRSPLAEALSQGRLDACDLLVSRGAEPLFDPEEDSSPLAIRALRSPEPWVALGWLRSFGEAALAERDAYGASAAERAWEELPFDLARSIWEISPDSAKLRSGKSPFGALERAARAPADAERKCAFLLEQGLRPARADAALAGQPQRPRQAQEIRIRLPDGQNHSFSLNAFWLTAIDPPESVLPPAPPSEREAAAASDFEVDLSLSSAFGDSPEPRSSAAKILPRPSLLGYSLVSCSREAFFFWLERDRDLRLFGPEDYRLAWREGVLSDAPAERLRALSSQAASLGIPLESDTLRHQAFRSLGLSKARSLGWAPISIPAWLESRSRENRKSFFGGSAPVLSTSEERPWRLRSPSQRSIDALLPLDAPWQGLASALLAQEMAQAFPQDGSALSRLIASFPERARGSDPSSPWGKDPGRALDLWEAQIAWESFRFFPKAFHKRPEPFGAQEPAAFERDDKNPFGEEGVFGSIASILLRQRAPRTLESLIAQGFPPPLASRDGSSGFWHRFGEALADSRSIFSGGASESQLHALRSLSSSIAASPAWAARIRELPGEVCLANISDPFVFSELLDVGASRRLAVSSRSSGGPFLSVFPRIAALWGGKISPAFAGRLAALSALESPGLSGLDVAYELARASSGSQPLSKTAIERAARAAAGAPLSAWQLAESRGACPISAAFSADRGALAIRLAEQAPSEWAQRMAPVWLARWLRGALTNSASFVLLFSERAASFGFLSESASQPFEPSFLSLPDLASHTLSNAQSFSEIARQRDEQLRSLLSFGSGFGSSDDALCAASILSEPSPSHIDESFRCLAWALRSGLRPLEPLRLDEPESSAEVFRSMPEALYGIRSGSALMAAIPSLHSSLRGYRNSEQGVSGFADLLVLWDSLGLPLALEADPDHPRWRGQRPPSSVIELLPDLVRSEVEQRLLRRQTEALAAGFSPPKKSRAL